MINKNFKLLSPTLILQYLKNDVKLHKKYPENE
jgi:hypothetical protein